jgi:hypothetical protein
MSTERKSSLHDDASTPEDKNTMLSQYLIGGWNDKDITMIKRIESAEENDWEITYNTK